MTLAAGLAWIMLLTAGCAQPGSVKAVSPYVVIVIGEAEYKTAETLPLFAKNVLEHQGGMRTKVLLDAPNNRHLIPNFADEVAKADLLLLSIRRRALPAADMDALHKYLDSGSPLVAIRTSSHAFDTKGQCPTGHAEWVEFDHEVIGGNYHDHYTTKWGETTITPSGGAENHPLLAGIRTPFISNCTLYKTNPLAESTTLLLIGSIPNHEPEALAWTNIYKKARVFYVALGGMEDFENSQFVRFLTNAIYWAMDKPIPTFAIPGK